MAMENNLFSYAGKEYSYSEITQILENELTDIKRSSRISAIHKMIEGVKILDVGCHVGTFARILAEEGREVLGVDCLQSAITIAKRFNQVKGVQYLCGDIFDMRLKDNEFDCILFLETIEHVDNPNRFLKEFYRILKAGGCLIVSTPNAVSYLNILSHLRLMFKNGQRRVVDSLREELCNTGTQLDHLFFWDFSTLLRLLIRSGFQYNSHKFAGAFPINVRIGKLKLSLFGKKELKFLLSLLGPYLARLIIKVNKPCINT